MKPKTARQLVNAIATGSDAPKTWEVFGGYRGQELRTLQSGLTYRQAKAQARAMREGGAYASAQRTGA